MLQPITTSYGSEQARKLGKTGLKLATFLCYRIIDWLGILKKKLIKKIPPLKGIAILQPTVLDWEIDQLIRVSIVNRRYVK